MKKELRFFSVFPSVVRAGLRSEVTVTATHPRFFFKDSEYCLRIVPKEHRDLPRNHELMIDRGPFTEICVKTDGERLCFEYFFEYEQEYCIHLLNSKGGNSIYCFRVYALDDDLYGKLPFKGDLHLHSTNSDGVSTIDEIASVYRANGFDFIALTDHHKYAPSLEIAKRFSGVDSGLKFFPGEEVHNCDMGYFHIVNFGGKYSINDIIESDYEGVKKQVRELQSRLDIPDNINGFEFAFRKWIADEIRKSGGKAIFPHPFWTIFSEYHTETHMTAHCIKEGIFDWLELVAGCTPAEMQLMASLLGDLRAQGVNIPIVGSSDSHDVEGQSCGTEYTLVFSADADGISDAITEYNSVAVLECPKDSPRIYGSFRLVKYAQFLLENFYPVYLAKTKDIGALMRVYADDGDCVDAIDYVNSKAQDFKNKYFGR